MKINRIIILLLAFPFLTVNSQDRTEHPKTSGNPLFSGWYADPEGVVLDNEYWIYPTYSDVYEKQTFFDAFSSDDLISWHKHSKVLSIKNIKWLKKALWAPAIVMKGTKYYLFFGANDIQSNDELGGIGVAEADRPDGPFIDYIGKPLIDKIVNGAQPIDQFVFKDDDGQYYMYYGGWGHCNMVKLSSDFKSIVPFEDGELYKEVTPKNYVEGPFMLKRGGKYYFMWSEGGWGGPNYSVAYAISDTPFGPFRREGKILMQDIKVATGAGHNSVIKGPGKDEFYIVYHRRPLEETKANNRVTCIDRLYFDMDGKIKPVSMTFEGVGSSPYDNKQKSVNDKYYSNPVINYSLPDPSIIKADDGYFYIYATESMRNLPIHRSRNLVDWSYVGTAFNDSTRPNFESKAGIWAPDINKIGDKYVMYYSMSRWGGEWTCGIGVAVSDYPQGPFEDKGKLFRSNEINIKNCIDPFYIEDNGHKYLFWGSFRGIYATELADDGLNLKQGADTVKIAGTAYEGTYIYKKNGYYYMFASTGTCCEGLKSTYTTVVGRSKNLYGPYVDKKGESMLENHHEKFIGKNYSFVGTGHNSEIVTDDNGNEWIFYHAVSKANPHGRVLMMDKVLWKDEWPYIDGGTPSIKDLKPYFKK